MLSVRTVTHVGHEARETILRTTVHKILSKVCRSLYWVHLFCRWADALKMPKGGLLHAHLDATVRADVLLRLALKHPAMHVRTVGLVSQGSLQTVLPEFRALPKQEWTQAASITDPRYVLDTWVPLQNARNNFSEGAGGIEGFDRWVISSLMINPSEAYGTHNTTSKVSIYRCLILLVC